MEREYLETLFILNKLMYSEIDNEDYIKSYKIFKNQKQEIIKETTQLHEQVKNKNLQGCMDNIGSLFTDYMCIESDFVNIKQDVVDLLKKRFTNK